MKKKIVFKIILSCISVAFFIFTLSMCIKAIQGYFGAIEYYKKIELTHPKDYNEIITPYITNVIYHILYCIPPLLLLIVTLFSDFEVIRLSLIKTVKAYRIKTAEQRETKRQAKIQRKIAQKQAEIERLNNSAKNE